MVTRLSKIAIHVLHQDNTCSSAFTTQKQVDWVGGGVFFGRAMDADSGDLMWLNH